MKSKIRKCYSLTKEGKNDKRAEKWKNQREEYGFDDTELWNLDWTIAKFIYPRLKMFRENGHGYPGCFNNCDEWDQVLDKMIYAFEAIAKGNCEIEAEEVIDKIEDGMNLFCKHYGDLWN